MGFSEYLSTYLKDNKISVTKLAKTLDVERTTIYRYINGERVPKDVESVDQIAKALCMKNDERSKLFKEYDKAVLGDDVVNSYIYLKDLLNGLNNAVDIPPIHFSIIPNDEPKHYEYDTNFTPIYSTGAIKSFVGKMLREVLASKKTNRYVKTIMHPTNKDINGLLIPFLGGTDIRLEQIVCFEKMFEKCYVNLEILKNVIPLSFSLKNYNAFYHYDNLESHYNSMSILPNLIVTNSEALMFDHEGQSGFYSSNPKVVKYFSDMFDKNSQTCFTLLEKGNDTNDVRTMNQALTSTNPGTLFNSPCLAPCLDYSIMKKRICNFPQKNKLIDSLIYQYGDWNGSEHIGNKYVDFFTSFCTKNGFRYFVETGRVGEFPEFFYEPFTVEERINVLKRSIIMIKDKHCEYIIAKDGIALPDKIQLYYNKDEKTVAFRQISKNKLLQISVNEISVFNTVVNYIEYLKMKNLILSEKEAVDFIQDLIDNKFGEAD